MGERSTVNVRGGVFMRGWGAVNMGCTNKKDGRRGVNEEWGTRGGGESEV